MYIIFKMKNWLFLVVTLTTFISSAQTKSSTTIKNRFYIIDETGKKTKATASLNGKIIGSVNEQGWVEISGLKLNDKIRIYKSDYDTLFYFIQSELDLGKTLYGQMNPTKFGFKSIAPWNQQIVNTNPVIDESLPGISTVDEPTDFPGGRAALEKYFKVNLVYPESAKKEEIEGKVYVRFTVLENGTISKPFIQKKLVGCPECDQEALRLVEEMPRWIPAKKNGKAVKCFGDVTVVFRLE